MKQKCPFKGSFETSLSLSLSLLSRLRKMSTFSNFTPSTHWPPTSISRAAQTHTHLTAAYSAALKCFPNFFQSIYFLNNHFRPDSLSLLSFSFIPYFSFIARLLKTFFGKLLLASWTKLKVHGLKYWWACAGKRLTCKGREKSACIRLKRSWEWEREIDVKNEVVYQCSVA